MGSPVGLPRLVRFKLGAIRGFHHLLLRVLGLGALYVLARGFGTLEYLLSGSRRKRFGRRLERVFGRELPAAERRRHTRNHMARIRADKTFYTVMDLIPRDRLGALIQWTGREHLDASIARGKGTYILFSHHGSHHVGGLLLAMAGYRDLAAIRDPHESPLRRYIQEQFAQTFPEFRENCRIFMAGTFPRELFRHFKKNGVLGSGLDVDRIRGENVKTARVQLFGQEHEWMTGTVNLALRTGATIVPGFVLSEPGFRYRLLFKPPLCDPDQSKDDEATVQRVMEAYARGIEEHVQRYPEHISRTK